MMKLEELASETTQIKDNIIECYNELKSKFPEGDILETDKLIDMMNKLPQITLK